MVDFEEFETEFKLLRSESILKRFKENENCVSKEKVYVALAISEKRLMSLDDIIDLAEFNLIEDFEWEFIKSDKEKPKFANFS